MNNQKVKALVQAANQEQQLKQEKANAIVQHLQTCYSFAKEAHSLLEASLAEDKLTDQERETVSGSLAVVKEDLKTYRGKIINLLLNSLNVAREVPDIK